VIPLLAKCGPEVGYSSMTAALEGGEWSATGPGRTLPPRKTLYPFYRRLGWLQDRSGRAASLVPAGIRSRTVQPVVSRYTDWATRPTHVNRMNSKREVSQVLNNNPQGSQLTGRPRNGSWNCVQMILIDANLKTGESGQKTDLTWRNPLTTRRLAFDYSAI